MSMYAAQWRMTRSRRDARACIDDRGADRRARPSAGCRAAHRSCSRRARRQHEFALVGLADVEMTGTEGGDHVQQRLQRLAHERLQQVAFDRQPQPRHARRPDGVVRRPRGRSCFAPMKPRVVSTPTTRPPSTSNAGHLAVLDDVDAARVGAAREAPGHRVVPRRAAARLQQPAGHREARVVEKSRIGTMRAHLLAVEQHRVDAVAAACALPRRANSACVCASKCNR